MAQMADQSSWWETQIVAHWNNGAYVNLTKVEGDEFAELVAEYGHPDRLVVKSENEGETEYERT